MGRRACAQPGGCRGLTYPTIPYERPRLSHDESVAAARSFLETLRLRRTVREFSSDSVPDEVLELASGFLLEILERPKNEKAYLLVPVGYPADGCRVPQIAKKTLADVMVKRF